LALTTSLARAEAIIVVDVVAAAKSPFKKLTTDTLYAPGAVILNVLLLVS
jgi:hypothetical protein